MRQLTGIESLCLRLESAATPMHVSTLAVYDRASAPGGKVEFADILRHFRERTHRAGIFRRRVVQLPMGLARPYWIEERDFDIEFHLRHLALPRPGDWQQLTTQVARLHSRPLDQARPLWECYVIDELDRIPGVTPGSFALFIKTHYAALGGALGTQLFAALHELAPDSRASAPKGVQFFDRPPTTAQLLLASAVDTLKTPLTVARWLAMRANPLLTFGSAALGRLLSRQSDSGAAASARAAQSSSDTDAHAQSDSAPPPASNLSPPHTRFNGMVSPHRVVEAVRFDLAEVERIRDKVPGATVLDVALAVIAGALHRYLDARLELPAVSLVAEVPSASRSGTRVYASPTLADSTAMRLFTEVEDQAERLRLIVAEARHRRADFQSFLGRRLMLDAVELVPDLVLGMAGDLVRRARLVGRLGPMINTSVASVRGPDTPLYLAGARLVDFYGLQSLSDLTGLAHLVGYYNGAMTISVTACRVMLPEPTRYADSLRRSYRSLGHALGVFEPEASAQILQLPQLRSSRAQRARKGRSAA